VRTRAERCWAVAAGLIGLMMLGASPGGCASPRVELGSLAAPTQEQVHVVQILGRSAGGTGIPLGGGVVLTARHILKDPVVTLDGRRTRYEVLARGEGEGDAADWALIRSPRAPETGNSLRAGRRPAPGTPVCAVGYWQGPVDEKLGIWEMRNLPLQCIRGTAAATPFWADGTAGLLFFEAPLKGESYHGISGGPVAVAEGDGWRIIGVYKGCWDLRTPWGTRTLHVAVLVPGEVEKWQMANSK
jgi:hypothetical protein